MINQFTTLTSTAIPLKIENVDTDQIIPARFLKATTREGFGKQLFFDWRYDAQGNPKTDFVLNSPDYTGEILKISAVVPAVNMRPGPFMEQVSK